MKLTLEQIKAATNNGIKVYTGSKNYLVIKDKLGRYLIQSIFNDYFIGLTHTDGVTLNSYGEFFIDTLND